MFFKDICVMFSIFLFNMKFERFYSYSDRIEGTFRRFNLTLICFSINFFIYLYLSEGATAVYVIRYGLLFATS